MPFSQINVLVWRSLPIDFQLFEEVEDLGSLTKRKTLNLIQPPLSRFGGQP
ncbi:hypothetical protein H6G89_04165 [Oscillatoria sp. FACHB-1407]|uniref:hypothetical protein n=1 Tax=Oscillatoria sp. FACHB-1407 TaxID=2692847 RepID=UPI001983D457|nr:hypothetical protein [Oscillatoria sp. FACHB-1407]